MANRSSGERLDSAEELLLDIVDALEAHGLDQDQYQVYDSVDVEDLDRLLNSSAADVEIETTIEGYRVAITPSGVRVLDGN